MAVPDTETQSQTGSSQQLNSSVAVSKCFQRAALLVLSLTLLMVLITSSGALDTATVELGLQHYAERQPRWLPYCGVPMPLNTIINFGYMLCAAYWGHLIWQGYRRGIVQEIDAFFFFVFCTLGFVYGFVQLYRIVAQTVFSAIMDQWYTLPFFMMVYAWAQNVRGQSSWLQFYTLMCMSVLSYGLTLLTPVGFELVLGCHIALAVLGGCQLYRENPSDPALNCFLLALLSCCGFVGLKLLDPHLPHLHWVFCYVSGHFLSKICDVLQLHYVSKFFFTIVSISTGTVVNGRLKIN